MPVLHDKTYNYEEMNLTEIEAALNIKPVNKLTVSFLNSTGQKTLSTWEDAAKFLKELRKLDRESFNRFTTILGYEINNNDWIEIYYNIHISNS